LKLVLLFYDIITFLQVRNQLILKEIMEAREHLDALVKVTKAVWI